MGDDKFEGYVTRALEENDKDHGKIFDKLEIIDKKLTKLHIANVKGGILGGSITAVLALIGLWIKSLIIK